LTRQHTLSTAVASALLLVGIGGSGAARAAPDFAPAVAEDYDRKLESLFLDFHRNPELSYLETRTAGIMARELRAAGARVTEKVGGTGVVGVMRNGPGPTVLVRADMDGLPVKEASGLPYASTARQVNQEGVEMPVMHACGHDVHITSLIGTARRLNAMKDRWSGTVVFIAQPAEERIGGAKAMLKDGLYTRFPKPDYALAFHVGSDVPTGRIVMEPGLTYSSSDSVDIIVHGIGAHGASPHKGRDPIVMGAEIVLALQTLVSREVPPLKPAVITVGAFNAGLKHNIIPDQARLQLTVRSDDREIRQQLLDGIKRVAEGVGRMNGMPDDRLPEVRHSSDSTPPSMNDPQLTARLRAAIEGAWSEPVLLAHEREGMGAEDFAYLVQPNTDVPGVYFRVGGTPPAAFEAEAKGGPAVPSHHSNLFKIDPEPAVTLGTTAMTLAVLELVKPQASAAGAAGGRR
jgi:amidohydrolase